MIQALIPIIGGLLDKVLPDPQASADAKLKMLELAQKGELAVLDADVKLALGQIEVNKVEAASDSLFKSGWRPAVGWTCVFGLVYSFVAFPLLTWYSSYMAVASPPDLDMGTLITLLGGLLGLGGLRTYEKVKGVSGVPTSIS